MGFTRYWRETGHNDCSFDDDFVEEVRAILDASNASGVKLASADGRCEPSVGSDLILFNGAEPNDHESLVIEAVPSGFSFCKTARKPYDITVLAVLTLAEARGYTADVSADDPLFNAEEAAELLKKAGINL